MTTQTLQKWNISTPGNTVDIIKIEAKINPRLTSDNRKMPRQALDFRKPYEVFN